MIAWLAVALQVSLAAVSSPSSRLARTPECIYASDAIVATTTLATGEAVALAAGTVTVAGRRLTRCDGLPAAHPTAIAGLGERLAIGFRDGGVWLRDGDGNGAWVEGLPRSPVRALASTGSRLWIGTGTAGLHVLDDGVTTRFEHRLLGRRGITALAVDAAGELHVGLDPLGHYIVSTAGKTRRASKAAVACFRGPRAAVIGPGTPCRAGDAPATDLPSDHITALVVHRGRLVIGLFDQGIVEKTKGGFRSLDGAPRFINALLSSGETLYAATPKGLFRRVGDGDFRRMRLGAPSEHINGLEMASDGALWIATGDGLIRWQRGATKIIGVDSGLPSRIVYAVRQSGDGAIWAGTAEGLARIKDDSVEVFDQAGGDLPHDWVTSVIADDDGVLVGTYDAGVARCSATGCQRLEAFGRAWINPHGLFRLEGDVIAATTLGDGLIVSSGNHRLEVPALPSDDVTAIAFIDDRLWIGTRGGLAVF